ncbi:SMP-30/gluconolactonase/LRE family protein [Limobrevibacterium gyesilva]|uniref:SMP-30/gluconolactonase/LRE family protein n=1 Tax=Limobrevibacterium gyesilva TaxID=2991712 RepID=A0AA42CJ92_9PROT|nr:SMP-30/gluconolactonase/LRE family protein [Limobrevibacterium gyesilva]MCW3476660.1 SMP-30/gluconolactonase/LRE family protein [Limobrevibacterium gyesilva]
MLTSDFEVRDPRFRRLVMGNVHVEKLFTGCRWAEGPAYFPAGRYLVWSDIPNNRMLRWDETDGSVSVFREPANNSNGNTVDREGRLVRATIAAGWWRAPSMTAAARCWRAIGRASGSTRRTTWW